MTRPPRKALLIGVTEYDDPAIDSLPFIADDLRELGRALGSVGYEVVTHPAKDSDRDRIENAIEVFCREAATGQQLLIFLSGHGIHRDGHDYLLPSTANPNSRKFTERCLEIDFAGYAEDSRCGDVLVVVDACREGVRLQEKAGYSYVRSWSEGQRVRAAERTIAYLFACSSGEMARWAPAPEGLFSLFTRAFSRAIADDSVPGTLAAVREAVRADLEDLSAEHNVPLQKPHLAGDAEACARLVLVDRQVRAVASRGAPGWPDRARAHAVWNLVRPGPTKSLGPDGLPELAAELRDATVECVQAWSQRYEYLRRQLRDDPWWDDELAARMHERLSWIVTNVLNLGKLAEGDQPPLSAAEAALLVLAPFAQQLHRAHCAVAARPALDYHGDEGADFRRFVEGQRRVQRRLSRLEASGDRVHASAVRWSAFHRWLAQRPQVYRPDVVAGCLLGPLDAPRAEAGDLLRDVISEERLAGLLRALRTDPEAAGSADSAVDALAGADIPAETQTIAGGSTHEQQVRDRLIALILLVAEEFTIDAAALPRILIDHLGLKGGVEVAEVLRVVQTAKWSARGRTRVLQAECPHQSVQVALAEHTQGIAEVLRRIDVAAEADRMLEALRDLPTHVAADGLRPLRLPDGRKRYDSVGFRFRLDDDRVQELLMGEQLYGDPALAIRELYQNALDACRYRRARTQHLRNCGRWTAGWEGRIAFTQGVDDDGRAWLECRDNGIGMSERELSSVFSNAGARFADLPEFLEEQAAWDREKIDFSPNSRFGIGVLSYFMLGDEIHVSTARFSRTGQLQSRLAVDIDGPGSLCRVRRFDDDGESGTTIRIYLRPGVSVSCVDLLSRLLWVSEFPVTAADGSLRADWSPGVLSSRAPVGSADPLANDPREMMGQTPAAALPSANPHVWWCAGLGGILADGLWAGDATFGRIVNLTGPLAPRLTIDRRRILAMDHSRARALQETAIPALIGEGTRILTLRWLGKLTGEDAQLADAIGQAIVDAGVTYPAGAGVTIDPRRVGVFPLDDPFFVSSDFASSAREIAGTYAAEDGRTYPHLGEWRLRAYVRAGLVPGLRTAPDGPAPLPARPSDMILLTGGQGSQRRWLDVAAPVPAGHVMRVSLTLGRPPSRVAARLRELGADPVSFPWPDRPLTNDDRLLLAPDKNNPRAWLDLSKSTSFAHVMAASTALGWSPSRAAEGLRELGADVPEFPWPDAPLGIDDQRLLGSGPGALGRWIDLSGEVPIGHVLRASAAVDWPPARAAGRMRELGATVPDFAWPETPLSADDQVLLSYEIYGNTYWLDLSERVSVAHVMRAGARLGWPPSKAAARLRELGADLPGYPWPEASLSAADQRLLTYESYSMTHWLNPSRRIAPEQVMRAAARMAWPPSKAAARLRELGAELPEFAWPQATLTADDQRLLLQTGPGPGRWLELSEPVSSSHVLGASAELEWSPRRTAERLRELGARVRDVRWWDLPLTAEDRHLLTLRQRPDTRWLDLSEAAPARHVLAASATLGWAPRRVAERLRTLGAEVPDAAWPDFPLGSDDQHLLGAYGTAAENSWLDITEPAPAGYVLGVAAMLGWSPRRVAERLRELGADPADVSWLDRPLTRVDANLLSRAPGQGGPWITLGEPVDCARLLPGLNRSNLSVGQALARLHRFGAVFAAGITVVPEELPDAD